MMWNTKYAEAPERLPSGKFDVSRQVVRVKKSLLCSPLDQFTVRLKKIPPISQQELLNLLQHEEFQLLEIKKWSEVRENPILDLEKRRAAVKNEILLIEQLLDAWREFSERAELDASERAHEVLQTAKEHLFELKGLEEAAQDFLAGLE